LRHSCRVNDFEGEIVALADLWKPGQNEKPNAISGARGMTVEDSSFASPWHRRNCLHLSIRIA
jgi:hypothetical protein